MCKWGEKVDRVLTISARRSHTGEAYQRIVGIDMCIAPVIDALNAAGVLTEESCCGHGEGIGYIALMDGRCLAILQGKPQWDIARSAIDNPMIEPPSTTEKKG